MTWHMLTARPNPNTPDRRAMEGMFRDAQVRTDVARQEAVYLAGLLEIGVTLGEPVFDAEVGCGSCVWHVEAKDGSNGDGGSASAIWSWIRAGHLGRPEELVLRPVVPQYMKEVAERSAHQVINRIEDEAKEATE